MKIREKCELCGNKTWSWNVKHRTIQTPAGMATLKKKVCNKCGIAVKTLEKIINASK